MNEEYENRLTIKHWAENDRPREKLMSKGKNALSEAELIAILIGSGSRNETAVELAKRILNLCGDNLHELSKLSMHDLVKVRGIGSAKALCIIASIELGKRSREAEVLEREKISCSRDAYEVFQSILGGSNYEEFWILLLNKANKVLKKTGISEGGVSGTIVDPKKVFRSALDHHASSIILCHNHPSGNIQPSDADKKLTRKLRDAGELLEIAVLDHIIIGDDKYYSFADEGNF